MTFSRYLMAASCCAALAAGSQAYAQDNDGGIETVTVTAEKRSEDIQKVPAVISAFSAKDISDLQIKTTSDLTTVTPNVDIALPSGAGSQPIITIRGIGLNDYDTNNAGPNGVYIDEVYLSSPNSQNFQVFDLDRIEVLKGPQGTLYGRNASGGAINFITAKPTDDFNGYIDASYSSFNTYSIDGAIGGPITSDLDGRFAFVRNYSSGYFHNDFDNRHVNGTDNIAGRGQLLWKPTEQLSFLLSVHGGELDTLPTEYRHVGTLDPGTGALCDVATAMAGGCVDLFGFGTPAKFYHGSFNRKEHLKIHDWGASLRTDYSLDSIDLVSITAWQHNDKFHPEDTDADPYRLLEINYGVKSNTFSQEFRASQTKENYDWVAGLYYLTEDLRQNQPLYALLDLDAVFGAPGIGDGIAFQAFDHSHQVTDAYAVYGQGDYYLTDKLKLTLGGRYTYERKSFNYTGAIQYQQGGMDHFGPLDVLANTSRKLSDAAFSWRAGLSYQFTDDVMAYGSVATGFKSGDFNGSFLSTDPTQIARQLQPVKPENVTTFEIGVKSNLFDNRLIFNASLFYNDYRNMQVFALVPIAINSGGIISNLPVNVLDNAKKAHTEGADIGIIAKPWDALKLTVNMGILQTKLDKYVSNIDPSQPDYSGNQLPLAPRFSLSTMADYVIPLGSGSLDLQFSANYKSHQFFDISNDPYTTQNGYWLENARIAYDFSESQWEIAAFVQNLSDKQYLNDAFDLSNPFGFIEQVVGTPRTVGVEASYRF